MATKTYTVTSSTWTNYDSPASNFGANTTLKVGIIWAGVRQYYGYVQSPPLSWYNNTGTINGLRLYLYGTQVGSGNPYGVSWTRVKEITWDEATITWNSDPEGDFGSRTDTVGTFPTSGGGWVYCDCGASIAEDWRDGNYANTGLFLTRYLAAGGNNNFAIINSDDATSNKPYWELDFTPDSVIEPSKQLFFKAI